MATSSEELHMSDALNISGRAMLVALRISTWTARKFDKRVTAEINAAHGADADAGRYNKLLITGESYRNLIKTCNAARSEHYAQTLAWSDEGWRLLPTANYMEYSESMRRHAAAFDDAFRDFAASYPDLREAARDRLNGMWRAEDYPTLSDLRHRFRFGVEYAPLPSAGDFRLSLPEAELDALGQQVEDRVTAATREAMADAWGRLSDVVEKMHERLATPDAIFRDSLVGNVRELVDILARLNVTDDPDLETMRERVARELSVHEAATLREDGETRQETADAAAKILADMRAVYGGAS